MIMGVFPDFGGLDGIGELSEVIGALLTFVLVIAVLMLIVCAIVWALATANGHRGAVTEPRSTDGLREGRAGVIDAR